jgi:hypothetical protein
VPAPAGSFLINRLGAAGVLLEGCASGVVAAAKRANDPLHWDKRDSVLTVAVGHMRALFHGTKRIMLTASEYRRSCLYYFSFLKSANNEIMPAF